MDRGKLRKLFRSVFAPMSRSKSPRRDVFSTGAETFNQLYVPDASCFSDVLAFFLASSYGLLSMIKRSGEGRFLPFNAESREHELIFQSGDKTHRFVA